MVQDKSDEIPKSLSYDQSCVLISYLEQVALFADDTKLFSLHLKYKTIKNGDEKVNERYYKVPVSLILQADILITPKWMSSEDVVTTQIELSENVRLVCDSSEKQPRAC